MEQCRPGVFGVKDWGRRVLDWPGRRSARGASHVFRFDGSVGCGRASAVAGNRAGVSRGPSASQQGHADPPDPPRPEEIVLVMRQAGHDRHGLRVRALVAVLWRGGLRISEALALNETDIGERRGSLLIRRGLCRIRHNPCYAESPVMPNRPQGRAVCPAQRDSRC